MKKADFSYSGFTLKEAVIRKILVISVLALLVQPAISWAKDARAYSAVSPGIERLDSVMAYPVANDNEVGKIAKVYIDVSYAGNAAVHSELCHASGSPCIQVGSVGRQSTAFEGLDAAVGFVLKHNVQRWGSSPRPLFIQSNLGVWTQ